MDSLKKERVKKTSKQDQLVDPLTGHGGDYINSLCSSLKELLECHVCLNFMHPPISQCRNGHTLCSKCKARVYRCPTCRETLGDIRNLALEKLTENLKLPCEYRSLGCQEIIVYGSKSKHESDCPFRPYNCPCSRCIVSGDIPFLGSHLKNDHGAIIHKHCTFTSTFLNAFTIKPGDFGKASWNPMVCRCFGQYFCLQFDTCLLNGVTPVYMYYVQFIGENCEAQKYLYRLEVGDDKGRRQIWEGVTRSIRDKDDIESHDGLIIQEKAAKYFTSKDGEELVLIVKGRIWEA